MKTSGIIFDIDGTLWDTTQRITEVYTVILEREKVEGKVITVGMLASVMGFLNEDIAVRLFPELSCEKRMRLIETYCKFECECLRKRGGRLYPHVEDTLEELSARYPLYIISNYQDGCIEAMFAAHGLQRYFRDYERSGRTRKAKFENLESIVERSHLQRPVYIGDTKTDQVSCCKAGASSIYAFFGFSEADDYAANVNTFSKPVQLSSTEQ